MILTTVLALASVQVANVDTAVFQDAATATLVHQAAVRHAEHVARLERYVARVQSHMEASISPTRFGPGIRLLNMDIVARVHWQRPADVSVELTGARTKVARLPGANRDALGGWFLGLVTSDPWFAPGAMGHEIDFMGIPDVPALHPLAPGADRFYRYAIVDSVRIGVPGRTVRTVAVSVEPRRYDASLVHGTMWLDADSLDVTRLSVAFVGNGLWIAGTEDHDEPRLVAAEADLEYALHEGRYWLPRRQILNLDWRYRYFPGVALPARAVTTFDRYRLTEVPPIALEQRTTRSRMERVCEPWSSRYEADACGTRREVRRRTESGRLYQLVIPPLDSLARYDFGGAGVAGFDDELVARRLTDLIVRAENLPAAARRPLHPGLHPALAQAIREGFRFNRVHGPSLGGTARFDIGPLVTLEPSARVSAGDERLTGSLALRRDGPVTAAWLEARHALTDAEPWTSGRSLSGTLRAIFLGDDAADYYLVSGVRAGVTSRLGPARGTRLQVTWERQRSVVMTDGSVLHDVFFGDGRLPPNPPIIEGDFGRVLVSRRFDDVAGATLELGVEGLGGGERAAVRGWLVGDASFAVGRRRARVVARAGYVLGDSLPQLEFRAGGRHTVRGYEYGVRQGRGVWAVQTEVEILPSDWVAPYLLVDAGDVIADRALDPLIGVGIGIVFGNGWLRVDLMKGVNPPASVRADIRVQVPVW